MFERLSVALTNHVRTFLDAVSDVSWSSCNKGLYACSEHESCWRHRARLWYPEHPWIHTRAQFIEHWQRMSSCHERFCQASPSSIRILSIPSIPGESDRYARLMEDHWVRLRMDWTNRLCLVHSMNLEPPYPTVLMRVPFEAPRDFRFSHWLAGDDGGVVALMIRDGARTRQRVALDTHATHLRPLALLDLHVASVRQLAVLDIHGGRLGPWIDVSDERNLWVVSVSTDSRALFRTNHRLLRYHGGDRQQTVSLPESDQHLVQVDWIRERIIVAIQPDAMWVYSFHCEVPIQAFHTTTIPRHARSDAKAFFAYRELGGYSVGGWHVMAQRGHADRYVLFQHTWPATWPRYGSGRVRGPFRLSIHNPGFMMLEQAHGPRARCFPSDACAPDEYIKAWNSRWVVLGKTRLPEPAVFRVLDFQGTQPLRSRCVWYRRLVVVGIVVLIVVVAVVYWNGREGISF
jgi:hypothetical protein